jgi:hypothetical protein
MAADHCATPMPSELDALTGKVIGAATDNPLDRHRIRARP